MNEKLSAFLDNEATGDEADSVVSELLRDESLRESWTRQHWIRTTLRSGDSESAVSLDAGFSQRVMAAIESEKQAGNAEAPAPRGAVVPMRGPRRQRRWRGVAGLAAAASVAGIVVLAGNSFTGARSGAENHVATNGQKMTRQAQGHDAAEQDAAVGDWDSQLADFNSLPSQKSRAVRSQTVAVNAPTQRSTDQWSVSDPAVRSELNGYLADHNGMARGYGMYSTTPALVRATAYRQGLTQ